MPGSHTLPIEFARICAKGKHPGDAELTARSHLNSDVCTMWCVNQTGVSQLVVRAHEQPPFAPRREQADFFPSRSCVRISRRLRFAVTLTTLFTARTGVKSETVRLLCYHTSLRRKRFSTLRHQNRTGEFVTQEPRDEASSTVTDDDFVRQADTSRCHSACTSRTVKATVVQGSALMQ